MKKFYLRMEGVNISNFIYDTQDLNTMRGGGLLLLDSVKMVEDKFEKLEPISTGASSGFFQFEVDDDDDDPTFAAENLRNEVEDFLNGHDGLCHATFMVDVLPVGEGFAKDRELLMARNRWRQMRSPAVAVPAINENKNIYSCDEDLVSPAVESWSRSAKNQNVSKSVKARYYYGVMQKQGFYDKETKQELGMEYVWDFDKLSGDPSKGNLNHKIAVIYLDGNGFGKLQKKCNDIQELKELFGKIKDYRKILLEKLLRSMEGNNEWLSDQRYRIETLLWGGDEIIWVVPAWRGWEALKFFYENSKQWEFNGNKLTHAGGIVFCHHNAPIHRITALAHDLAELAKEQLRSKASNENLFAYQVLESIDFVAGDLEEFRKTRCPAMAKDGTKGLLLLGEDMGNAATNMKVLKEEFPKSKLHTIVSGLLSSDNELNKKGRDVIKKAIKTLSPSAKEAFDELSKIFNGDDMMWVHIVELWDYLGPSEEV